MLSETTQRLYGAYNNARRYSNVDKNTMVTWIRFDWTLTDGYLLNWEIEFNIINLEANQWLHWWLRNYYTKLTWSLLKKRSIRDLQLVCWSKKWMLGLKLKRRSLMFIFVYMFYRHCLIVNRRFLNEMLNSPLVLSVRIEKIEKKYFRWYL